MGIEETVRILCVHVRNSSAGLWPNRAAADLATLIAMADSDEVIRLRLLRAIRDLGAAVHP